MKKSKLEYVKSTKGTHVYADTAPFAPVSTLYIRRDQLPNEAPKSVELTITFEE